MPTSLVGLNEMNTG